MVNKKRGQEEMVGFALIVIVVVVILVVFLAISLRKGEREPIESYKVGGFINSLLQYHTSCEDRVQKFIPVRDLIYWCEDNELCLNGDNSCDVLEDTLKGILDASWRVGEDTPVKGYVFSITIDEAGDWTDADVAFEAGNKTYNSFGSSESLPHSVEVRFKIYY
jgi:hypothetical protein